jgi:mycofactocin precursor peptide peptidase
MTAASLADLAWPEAERDATRLPLLVPVGATEQHGPHLPLGTDSAIALALAEAAAEQLGCLVAPLLPYGSSGEHAGFAGTISIGREATELVLVELCRSATASFERVLLVSAHGGNAEPVRNAVARLRGEGREVRAWSPNWKGDAHAGRVETSVMLALDPARVRPELAAAGNTAPLAELIGELRTGGVAALAANGVLGDPTGASAAEGRELFDAAAADLVATIEAGPPR